MSLVVVVVVVAGGGGEVYENAAACSLDSILLC